MAADYGVDVSCVSDLDETLRVVSGARLLAEACVRRLTTPRGMVIDDPDYGTDLRELLNDSLSARGTARLQAAIRAELLKDERVVSVLIPVLRYTLATRTLYLEIAVEALEETLRLTVAISAVTVALLAVE